MASSKLRKSVIRALDSGDSAMFISLIFHPANSLGTISASASCSVDSGGGTKAKYARSPRAVRRMAIPRIRMIFFMRGLEE